MMWLYARHVIFFEHILLHKACIEGFCFEKNMLKFVCWFYFQVLAVLYFLPWFQVTFWEGVQTMRKSANNAHLHDVHEVRLSRHGQWLLSFGNISKNVHKTKQKLNQKTTLWPYVPNHSWTSIAFFCFVFWQVGAEVAKGLERTRHTHTKKNSRLKTQKTLNGGP